MDNDFYIIYVEYHPFIRLGREPKWALLTTPPPKQVVLRTLAPIIG
jgi:hypothetical protein